MSAPSFAGRTALVTGGSRGIGRAVCEALAAGGARVAVNYAARREAAEATVESCRAAGAQAACYQADVADEQAVAAMVRAIEGELGPVDLLVTSAGIVGVAEHRDMTLAQWQDIMRVNVDGTYIPVMAVKDGMLARDFGRIVCIASIAGLASRPRMVAYSTSKAAVIGFVRSIAGALAPAVRVNAVAPGLVETDMTANVSAKFKAHAVDEAPLGRTGQPAEIADAVCYLLSEQSSFVCGQTLSVDGGRVMLR